MLARYPRTVETVVVFASCYRRCECGWCGDVSYYVLGMYGDKLDFVPSPWSEDD